jgi:thiol-disulfide isomerase/thioredoxin
MWKRTVTLFALSLIFLLSACSGGQTAVVNEPAAAAQAEAAEDEQMDDMIEDEAMDDMADDEAMDDMAEHEATDDMAEEEAMDGMAGDEAMDESMTASDPAAWQTISLANAATGDHFTLADFAGKTVFVEPMATWCSNCRAQQGQVREAKGQLGDDVVFIGLSLETNLPPGDLAAYARDNGFDWTYAVMTVDLLDQLADQFGRSITSAPSTPHFIIRPDGSFSDLATGIHSADEIIAEIRAQQS